jgi:hypothetical protein
MSIGWKYLTVNLLRKTGTTLNDQFATTLELLTEDKQYNYIAYLIADANVTSIKLAGYKGLDRQDLIENYKFGNCSIIKGN